jgi:prohibitin 1
MKKIAVFSTFLILFTSCTVVREGEVGVKRTLGTYKEKPFMTGLRWFNPFTTSILKVSTQTENLEVALTIPSREGLNINSEVSILYNVIPNSAPDILRNIGPEYERNIILPVFRSAVADVSARFFAKDMHTGERGKIEEDIRAQMQKLLDDKGIEIETVLLKSIQLPPTLARAIEAKLEAEQNAQRMEFVLQQEKQEAERKRFQAEGIRDAQNIISQGLDPMLLQFKAIEAFMELSKSPNAKVIITDGKGLPMMIDPIHMGETRSNTPTGGMQNSGIRINNN